ncbi:uncharacterized protein N7479_009563 [Penicillium vulpinum]|uniref:Ipa protein n=1 Tax=Penicillium vulpinum TaxID=29845 RepID=A0A1V6RZ95_9EURO|nr:uncharacterized protein N7479_009563 [Penicillium vulpinum]KAJ5951150.1 hypothetical protein N7479_009563 [Penicillium vulpinum]OQE06743.1 hypothetical protein PENVUL_c016G08070 [Penicillium vulpinum]
MDNERATFLKELHSDLARKCQKHATVVETNWRSFNPNERANCFKAGAADGVVLKHSLDRSLGNVYKIIPDLNLHDIMSDPDYLLNLLKHRATKTLFEQYCEGVNGGPGDYAMIEESVRTRGLKHVNSFKNCYTMFQGSMYAISVQVLAKEALAALEPAIRAHVCLPQSVGEFVMHRQIYTLQTLNILIEDILDQGSKSRAQKAPTKKEKPTKPTDTEPPVAVSKSVAQPPRKKLTLSDLVASARDHQDRLEEYLRLLSTEPVVLAHAVNIWFFSRPELIPDEKGRRLPVHTDKYISAAVFEAIHSSIQGAATWNYIASILELLEKRAEDRACRAVLLQEISNICQLELNRAQTLFKRHVQTATGSNWFKRTSNMYDSAGNPRVGIKGKPEDLTVSDPQLHYMLRLCQPKLTVSNAITWMQKLSEFQKSHPREREKLVESEADSLGDLAIIIGFILDFSSVIPIPSFSNNKGQMFVSKSREVESEFNHVKDQLDLLDFVVPIDNLLEPGAAVGALKKLDQFAIEKFGTKMGFVYQDMVADCLSGVQEQCEDVEARFAQGLKAEFLSALGQSAESTTIRVEQRKQKEKTRPSHSSVYDIVVSTKPASPQEPALPQTFNIDDSTAEIFKGLFCKSESRGSVPWVGFTEAMTKLGFSVNPKYGSVYTFYPPESMAARKSLTLHRPHGPKIEGYRLLMIARRVRTLYGWGEETFRVE